MKWFVVGFSTVFMIFFAWLYIKNCHKLGKKYLPFKGLATLMPAVMVAVFSLEGQATHWLLFAAIVVYALADILLELYFPAGVVAFLCAQILFLVNLKSYANFGILTVLVLAAIILLFVISYKNYLKELGALVFVGIIYVAALGSVCAMNITWAVQARTIAAILSGLGGLLFVSSDYILASTFFKIRKTEKWQTFILVTYYSAVYLFALAGCLSDMHY
ncbi:MAG: lysoplasmalogenase family protein [Agathobacter sp.]